MQGLHVLRMLSLLLLGAGLPRDAHHFWWRGARTNDNGRGEEGFVIRDRGDSQMIFTENPSHGLIN